MAAPKIPSLANTDTRQPLVFFCSAARLGQIVIKDEVGYKTTEVLANMYTDAIDPGFTQVFEAARKLTADTADSFLEDLPALFRLALYPKGAEAYRAKIETLFDNKEDSEYNAILDALTSSVLVRLETEEENVKANKVRKIPIGYNILITIAAAENITSAIGAKGDTAAQYCAMATCMLFEAIRRVNGFNKQAKNFIPRQHLLPEILRDFFLKRGTALKKEKAVELFSGLSQPRVAEVDRKQPRDITVAITAPSPEALKLVGVPDAARAYAQQSLAVAPSGDYEVADDEVSLLYDRHIDLTSNRDDETNGDEEEQQSHELDSGDDPSEPPGLEYDSTSASPSPTRPLRSISRGAREAGQQNESIYSVPRARGSSATQGSTLPPASTSLTRGAYISKTPDNARVFGALKSESGPGADSDESVFEEHTDNLDDDSEDSDGSVTSIAEAQTHKREDVSGLDFKHVGSEDVASNYTWDLEPIEITARGTDYAALARAYLSRWINAIPTGSDAPFRAEVEQFLSQSGNTDKKDAVTQQAYAHLRRFLAIASDAKDSFTKWRTFPNKSIRSAQSAIAEFYNFITDASDKLRQWATVDNLHDPDLQQRYLELWSPWFDNTFERLRQTIYSFRDKDKLQYTTRLQIKWDNAFFYQWNALLTDLKTAADRVVDNKDDKVLRLREEMIEITNGDLPLPAQIKRIAEVQAKARALLGQSSTSVDDNTALMQELKGALQNVHGSIVLFLDTVTKNGASNADKEIISHICEIFEPVSFSEPQRNEDRTNRLSISRRVASLIEQDPTFNALVWYKFVFEAFKKQPPAGQSWVTRGYETLRSGVNYLWYGRQSAPVTNKEQSPRAKPSAAKGGVGTRSLSGIPPSNPTIAPPKAKRGVGRLPLSSIPWSTTTDAADGGTAVRNAEKPTGISADWVNGLPNRRFNFLKRHDDNKIDTKTADVVNCAADILTEVHNAHGGLPDHHVSVLRLSWEMNHFLTSLVKRVPDTLTKEESIDFLMHLANLDPGLYKWTNDGLHYNNAKDDKKHAQFVRFVVRFMYNALRPIRCQAFTATIPSEDEHEVDRIPTPTFFFDKHYPEFAAMVLGLNRLPAHDVQLNSLACVWLCIHNKVIYNALKITAERPDNTSEQARQVRVYESCETLLLIYKLKLRVMLSINMSDNWSFSLRPAFVFDDPHKSVQAQLHQLPELISAPLTRSITLPDLSTAAIDNQASVKLRRDVLKILSSNNPREWHTHLLPHINVLCPREFTSVFNTLHSNPEKPGQLTVMSELTEILQRLPLHSPLRLLYAQLMGCYKRMRETLDKNRGITITVQDVWKKATDPNTTDITSLETDGYAYMAALDKVLEKKSSSKSKPSVPSNNALPVSRAPTMVSLDVYNKLRLDYNKLHLDFKEILGKRRAGESLPQQQAVASHRTTLFSEPQEEDDHNLHMPNSVLFDGATYLATTTTTWQLIRLSQAGVLLRHAFKREGKRWIVQVQLNANTETASRKFSVNLHPTQPATSFADDLESIELHVAPMKSFAVGPVPEQALPTGLLSILTLITGKLPNEYAVYYITQPIVYIFHFVPHNAKIGVTATEDKKTRDGGCTIRTITVNVDNTESKGVGFEEYVGKNYPGICTSYLLEYFRPATFGKILNKWLPELRDLDLRILDTTVLEHKELLQKLEDQLRVGFIDFLCRPHFPAIPHTNPPAIQPDSSA